MILNCTLPYRPDISNPALGYLKGFTQDKGIYIKNVYWNLILYGRILNFQRTLGRYSKSGELFPLEAFTIYIFRQLLGKESEDCNTLGLDVFLSSIFSREELSELVHSTEKDIHQVIHENNLYEVSLAGFTLKSFQWLMGYYLIRKFKELNPDMKIIIGGIYDNSQAQAFMRILAQADYAVWGEGEYPLYRLVSALQDGTDIKDVPNLVYREGSKIYSTGIQNSECIPLDSYPFADHSDYFETLRKFIPSPVSVFIPIWGSRSCNWNKCKFCVLNKGYQYRMRSPENIVEEIEFQSKKYNVDTFTFVDNDVAGNKNRFRKLLTLLAQSVANRRRPYQLYAEISPLFIDSEIAKYMKLVSFVQTQIGFEAVTDSLLEKMEKRHRFAHNIQVLKLGNQYGLKFVSLNILKGLPPETKEDIIESGFNLKFVRFFLRKYQLNPTLFVLYKGAPFYNEMSEEDKQAWTTGRYWEEIAPIGLVSESDRSEIFGFCIDRFDHHLLWQDFENVLDFYTQQNRSYEWVEYAEGSFVEERGLRYGRHTLDRDETDLLIYCDSVKSFSQLKKRFSHLSEDNLLEILGNLRKDGLLYYDKDLRTFVSVLEAASRKTV